MIRTGARTSKSTTFSTKKLKMSALTGSVSSQCVVMKLTKGLPYLGLISLPGSVPSIDVQWDRLWSANTVIFV